MITFCVFNDFPKMFREFDTKLKSHPFFKVKRLNTN